MNDTPYISDGCHSHDEMQQLKEHPLIKQFASVKPDLRDLIKKTNPTVFFFVQLAERIVEVEG